MFKYVLYFIFAPLFGLLYLWVYIVYGKDPDKQGWYQLEWEKKGILRKIFLVIIAPFIILPVGLLFAMHEIWEKWAE